MLSKPDVTAKKIGAEPARSKKSIPVRRARSAPSGEARQRMISTAAYYRAERRGFNGGNELQDWLEAEAEIDGASYD